MRRLGFLSILFVSYLYAAPVFGAANDLSSITTRIGDFPLRRYVPQGLTFELKNRQPENQQQSAECYLFAYTNYLQVANVNAFNHVRSPGISGPYLFAIKLLEFIYQSYQSDNPQLFLAGGNIQDAISLTIKYGLIPDQVWRPRVPFSKWPFQELYKNVERSLNINKNILERLSLSVGRQSTAYEVALKKAQIETSNIVLSLSGRLPKQFLWEGRNWTPRQFGQVYGVAQARNFMLYYPAGEVLFTPEQGLRKLMNSLLGSSSQFSIHQRNWPLMETKMRLAIDSGVPILVGLRWGRTGHVLTAVGYELRNNKVHAWKFLNSWGRWADGGEAFFLASDVRLKADQVWIIH